jgi:L-serine dehydratase
MRPSIFDMFTIGIGPSSSHAVGPMRAAKRFTERLMNRGNRAATASVRAELYGSLALTGKGHGTDSAVLMGLEGETPEGVDPEGIAGRVAAIRRDQRLALPGGAPVPFEEKTCLLFHRMEQLPLHPNGLRFTALDAAGATLDTAIYYSIGGGFVIGEDGVPRRDSKGSEVPYPFLSGADLLRMCGESGFSVSGLMLENEKALRPEAEVRASLMRIWNVMQECVERGLRREGVLPGGLKVRRRAPRLHRQLVERDAAGTSDPLAALDWVDLWALAVNEENAAGGRVVTAPTNGAAGILPSVLHYYARFCNGDEESIQRFLLTAGAIELLYKENASISGAEVGCQGEVGVACSMAAGALAEALGGSPGQVEEAAEIGMEHNLGLTCDPIGGLVQIPCIERNAMGAVKAINAARIALRGDGTHKVSLDKVIATMRRTGADMSSKYKETSRGGLAVNVIEC